MPADNKVAIVTGAARPWGLGRATAMGLARHGFDIVVADVRDHWGAEAEQTIAKETGRRALYVPTDVSKLDSVEALVAKTDEEFGRIDVLCNVAAIMAMERVEEMREETIDRILAVNLKGVMLTCQAVVKIMRRRTSGRIVNLATGGALQPLKGLGAYSASKAGVIIFTKILAWELARYGIVALTVAPGRIVTAMGQDEGPTEEAFTQEVRASPFLRALRPEEVAEVVVYAATAESPALAGQTLHANGGIYMV